MDTISNFINDSNIMPVPQIRILKIGRAIVKDWSHASPIRPHWRFYWNSTPGAAVSGDQEMFHLDRELILIIPPGVRARQQLISHFYTFYVHADIDLMLNETSLKLMSLPATPYLMDIIKRLCDSPDRILLSAEFIYAILTRLPGNIWQKKIEDPRIELICRQLRKNPEKEYNNRKLAVKACFSENAFIRRFREVTGLPPQRYLLKLRLEKAAELLLKSNMHIDEIAGACGFCDRNYLTRMFTKHFGQPPGRFKSGMNVP